MSAKSLFCRILLYELCGHVHTKLFFSLFVKDGLFRYIGYDYKSNFPFCSDAAKRKFTKSLKLKPTEDLLSVVAMKEMLVSI